jgi:hypothetical protein
MVSASTASTNEAAKEEATTVMVAVTSVTTKFSRALCTPAARYGILYQ